MSKKDLFIFDLDDTIIETSQTIIDIYNDIVGKEELNLNDFLQFDHAHLVPAKYDVFSTIIDNIQKGAFVHEQKFKPVCGVYDFFSQIVKENEAVIITKRRNKYAIKEILKEVLPGFEDSPILLVEGFKDKANLIFQILDTEEDSYKNIYLFEDNPEVIKEMQKWVSNIKIYIRKRPWNHNIFTYLAYRSPDSVYFSDYYQLLKSWEV